ncbi:MAG: glycosyltransferase family 9 protein [Myxococcota bacterium]|jgi:ADP-heptose:LPS heptosyltransferase|nr:glycosyltransferase family 9 protein [Myxococcota bacterium]
MDGNLTRKIDGWLGLVICAVLFVHSRLRARLGSRRQPSMYATTPPERCRAPFVPARVLCIKTYGLGNIAMILPVLGALRRNFPGVEIDFLTLEENEKLLEHSGLVERVIPLTMSNPLRVAGSLLRGLAAVRRGRYDLVLDFEQFIKLSTIFAYLSGARERIGFNTDGQRRGWLFTTRVVYNDADHMSRTFMRLLQPLGVDTRKLPVAFEHPAEATARVDDLLQCGGVEKTDFPLVAVHVGSGPNYYRVPLKRWPTEYFARLCDELVARHGARIVFTGKGEDEASLVRETLAQMQRAASVINACDALSIVDLLVLLDRCNLTVSNDTSIVHLAAAIHTPVVAFFGPTNPEQYGPGNAHDLVIYKDLYCGPCLTNYNLKVSYCADPICIRSISVEEVLAKIEARYLDAQGEQAAAAKHPDADPRRRLEVLEGSVS